MMYDWPNQAFAKSASIICWSATIAAKVDLSPTMIVAANSDSPPHAPIFIFIILFEVKKPRYYARKRRVVRRVLSAQAEQKSASDSLSIHKPLHITYSNLKAPIVNHLR